MQAYIQLQLFSLALQSCWQLARLPQTRLGACKPSAIAVWTSESGFARTGVLSSSSLESKSTYMEAVDEPGLDCLC